MGITQTDRHEVLNFISHFASGDLVQAEVIKFTAWDGANNPQFM